jgi:hypothetical protein
MAGERYGMCEEALGRRSATTLSLGMRFLIPPGHGYVSLVTVVYYHIEVFATT